MHSVLPSLTRSIAEHFGSDQFALSPLKGGASSRRYYLLNFRQFSSFPANPVLLMTVPRAEKDTLDDFMNIFYYLHRRGVGTPRLYEMVPAHGWIFTEFVEHPTVENYLKENPGETFTVYRQLLDYLLDIRQKCRYEAHCRAFQRRFDSEKYHYECRFHLREQLLEGYFKVDVPGDLFDSFCRELCGALDELSEPVFVHRDFQSSNIFIDPDQSSIKRFLLIDFQDARFGSPFYDLVSLLWDSYTRLSDPQRESLLETYLKNLPEYSEKWDAEKIQRYIDYTAIQRKLHDAGAFAYNYRRFNSPAYLDYIRPAVQDALAITARYAHFREFAEFLGNVLKER